VPDIGEFGALFGNSIVRTTGVPSARSRGWPSASITGTWQPSQLACWLPLANDQLAVTR
jgi:hypothetical protein